MQIIILFLTMMFSCISLALEGEVSTPAPESSPQWMINYNFYRYNLEGTRAANTGIYKFGQATIEMNLLTAAWLYSPQWTFMAFLPHIKSTIETIYEPSAQGLNLKLQDTTQGLGDLRLMAMNPLFISSKNMLFYDVGGTLPTGSINQYFSSAPNQRAAYNMQPGSGTVDLIGGLTFNNAWNSLATKVRGQVTARLGRNSNDYAQGHELLTQVTSDYKLFKYFSLGGVGNYRLRTAVRGRDSQYELFNSYVSPVDSQIQGDGHQYYKGRQINWDVSAVLKAQYPVSKKMVLASEVGLPLAQGFINKDNVTLNTKSWFTLALNSTF